MREPALVKEKSTRFFRFNNPRKGIFEITKQGEVIELKYSHSTDTHNVGHMNKK